MSAAWGPTEWSEEMDRLWKLKPRTLRQMYGENGPSPEQLAAYKVRVREWTNAWSRSRRGYKAALEKSTLAP